MWLCSDLFVCLFGEKMAVKVGKKKNMLSFVKKRTEKKKKKRKDRKRREKKKREKMKRISFN